MTYINLTAPRGYDLHALFAYPYQEGKRNISLYADSQSGRVGHGIAGFLLLIPVINTIVFLIFRDMFSLPIHRDKPPKLNGKLTEFNQRRIELLNQKLVPSTEIEKLELEAVKKMKIKQEPDITAHLSLSAKNHSDLIACDGQVHGPTGPCVVQVPTTKEPTQMRLSQIGGVNQYNGSNQLCGYYALFFMYQAVTKGNDFANRKVFHPKLERWLKMIAARRTALWLKNHRDQAIPASIKISTKGISDSEIQYLIENDPELNPLKTKDNCFLLEMDACDDERLEAIYRLGNKKLNKKFPIYFIMKGNDAHYYCVWAEKPWNFQIVHSAGHSVITRSNEPLIQNKYINYISVIAALITSVALLAIGACSIAGLAAFSPIGLIYGIPMIAVGGLIGGGVIFCQFKRLKGPQTRLRKDFVNMAEQIVKVMKETPPQ